MTRIEATARAVNQHEMDEALGPSDAAAAKAVAARDRAGAAGAPAWGAVIRGAKIMALQAHQASQRGLYQQALDIIGDEGGRLFVSPVPDMGNRLLKALHDAGLEATDADVAAAEAVIKANPGARVRWGQGARR